MGDVRSRRAPCRRAAACGRPDRSDCPAAAAVARPAAAPAHPPSVSSVAVSLARLCVLRCGLWALACLCIITAGPGPGTDSPGRRRSAAPRPPSTGARPGGPEMFASLFDSDPRGRAPDRVPERIDPARRRPARDSRAGSPSARGRAAGEGYRLVVEIFDGNAGTGAGHHSRSAGSPPFVRRTQIHGESARPKASTPSRASIACVLICPASTRRGISIIEAPDLVLTLRIGLRVSGGVR